MDIYIFLKKMDIYIYKPTVAANTIIILELIEKIISGVSLFHSIKEMSAYENVVGGKLKLKGKALDVAGGVKKKKKKNKRNQEQFLQAAEDEISTGGSTEQAKDPNDDEEVNDGSKLSREDKPAHYDDHLTPAERRYIEQREQLDVHRLAKIANKSHRDRIQDFNQYLANMSEHYDIPKVGPG
ncbi:uncharacterized protein [Cicer arietinum]